MGTSASILGQVLERIKGAAEDIKVSLSRRLNRTADAARSAASVLEQAEVRGSKQFGGMVSSAEPRPLNEVGAQLGPPVSMGHRDTDSVPPHLNEALSNLPGGSRRSRETLNEFGVGAAFSGVFNPESERFLAYPSSLTPRVDGKWPSRYIPRNGGHDKVNMAFCRLMGNILLRNVAFTIKIRPDGSLACSWLSRSVNGMNRTFRGDKVPRSMREGIMKVLSKATGREVRSARWR